MAPGTQINEWRHVLPPLTQTDTPELVTIAVHVPHESSVVVVVVDEGNEQFLTQLEDNTPPQHVDGVLTGRARFALPALLPGEYDLRATLEDGREAEGKVIVEPMVEQQVASGEEASPAVVPAAEEEAVAETLQTGELPAEPEVPSIAEIGREKYHGRNWGIATAVYALRSTTSWGIGDLADLADLAAVSARAGADYLLLRPFITGGREAVQELGLSIDDDRHDGMVIDPIYIRPEDIREVAYLPTSQRTMLEWGSETIRQTNTDSKAIDWEAVWEAKRAALDAIHSAPRSPMRQAELERFIRYRGRAIADYVHALVAVETEAPQPTFTLLSEDSTAGAALRRDLADRINFYVWLQWVGHQQLSDAAYTADNSGMRLGLIFSTSTQASEEFFTELMSHAGGVFLEDLSNLEADRQAIDRIHSIARDAQVLLFAGAARSEGRAALSEYDIFASTTVWHEYDGMEPRDAADFPRDAMVGVTTLDEPPTTGVLAGEYLELLNHLGLLDRPYEDARKDQRIRRERLLGRLRKQGLVGDDVTERQTVEGLYRYLAHTPSRMITVTIADAVGDRRPLVVGGTYPDWQLPITDGAGACVLIDDLAANARFASLVDAVDRELRGT